METERFNFLRSRDGLEKAIAFEKDLIKTYRRYLLTNKNRIKRRKLIEIYLQAKRIIREFQ